MMASLLSIAKALALVIGLLNTIYGVVVSKLDEESRAKLNAALALARKSKTVDEAADAAQKIDDSF